MFKTGFSNCSSGSDRYQTSFETYQGSYQNFSSGTYLIINDFNLDSTASQEVANVQHYVDDSSRNHQFLSTQSNGT
ncbi:unnamed protein product [Brachionus calyciflorus]|uniref:Uncharacterized protein n=1 Tax=Brachionus calyciflorus TaxID=104777 RepID=A0A814IGY4_9BILA|nr:unnamed protein product [Brachionus calyciflorus]